MIVNYEALRDAPIQRDPFAHVIVPSFVPPATLTAVIAALPPMPKGGSFPTASLRLGADAKTLIDHMQGAELREILATRFGENLDDAATMVTLRGQSRPQDGRIHCDSTAKRITVLLYLNQDASPWARNQGCLRLLRGPDDIEDYVTEIPPLDGTLLAFPNGPTAWHGHKAFVGPRNVVQLNYMANGAAARAELRRHQLSAAVKRLVG